MIVLVTFWHLLINIWAIVTKLTYQGIHCRYFEDVGRDENSGEAWKDANDPSISIFVLISHAFSLPNLLSAYTLCVFFLNLLHAQGEVFSHQQGLYVRG